MHGDQLGAVGKDGLHLDHRQEVRDALHDIVRGQDRRSEGDQIGHRPPVARAFKDLVTDQRHGFGRVQAAPPRLPLPGKLRSGEDRQPFKFCWCE